MYKKLVTFGTRISLKNVRLYKRQETLVLCTRKQESLVQKIGQEVSVFFSEKPIKLGTVHFHKV